MRVFVDCQQLGPNEDKSYRTSVTSDAFISLCIREALVDSHDKIEHSQSRGERKSFRPNETESLTSHKLSSIDSCLN